MTCGIYKITNAVNGKAYVGSSTAIETRWSMHRSELKNNHHHNKRFQKDINECGGVDVLRFEILEEIDLDYEKINQREAYWTQWTHDNTPGCYNGRKSRPRVDYLTKKHRPAAYLEWQEDINDPDYIDMMLDILQSTAATQAAIAAGCSEVVLRRFRNIAPLLPFNTWVILKRTLGEFVQDWQVRRGEALTDTRGGRRGTVSATLAPEIAAWLRNQRESNAVLIEAALISFYGLQGPEESEAGK